MTALRQRKTRLIIETDTMLRGRCIIVEPSPFIATVRLKGTRTRYQISWESVFMRAAQIAADQLRAERKARRKAKGGR